MAWRNKAADSNVQKSFKKELKKATRTKRVNEKALAAANKFKGNASIASEVLVSEVDVNNPLNIVDTGDLGSEKKNDRAYGPSKTFQRLPNPMHKFESANAVFTLAALTRDEVNFPDQTIMVRPPEFIIAKSAGGSSRKTVLAKDASFEFLIDDVVLEALVHSNPSTGHTQNTNVSFKVHEPFSLGVFLQNLQYQVALAAKDPNITYIGYPMVLIIEFIGSLTHPLTTFEKSQLRKVIPIQIQKINFGSNNGVSTYEVLATPLSEHAFMDANHSIPNDITLTGTTVEDMLWRNKNSLANILNEKHFMDAEPEKIAKQKARQNYKRGKVSSEEESKPKVTGVKDFIFLFPSGRWIASDWIRGDIDFDDQVNASEGSIETNQSSYSLRLEKTFGDIFNDLTYTLENGFRGQQWNVNKIGESKMITSYFENYGESGKIFGDDDEDYEKYYDKDTKTYKRGSATIDFKNKTISFKKGTPISRIIEDVILNSQYGQSIFKRKAEANTGLVQWFKIVPARYTFPDNVLSKVYNKHPDVYLFRILEYGVPDDKFMAPDDVSRIDSIDDLVRKEYDVLYSGNNKDVIDFNVEYNTAYYTAIMNDLGNNSGNSKDNANSSVNSKKPTASLQQSNNPFYSKNPPIDFGDPRNRDGIDGENLELKVARQFNEAILDSAVDLIKLDLTIVGDPYYISQSALGNYVANTITIVGDEKIPDLFMDGDSNANFLKNVVVTKMKFRTPIDINQQGDMAFTTLKDSEDFQTLGEFTGYYYPIKVVSTFANNRFTQDITLIRYKTGPKDEGRTQNKELIGTKKDEKDPNDAFGIGDDYTGLGVSA